jgi:hypothetical protein
LQHTSVTLQQTAVTLQQSFQPEYQNTKIPKYVACIFLPKHILKYFGILVFWQNIVGACFDTAKVLAGKFT